MSKAPQLGQMKLNEVRNVAVSFVGKLDAGENLTGTPTLALVGVGSGLTFSNIAVSTAQLTVNGVDVPAGRAVQFRVTAQAAGSYTVRVTAASTATPAQTLQLDLGLTVID